jgi:hypothetical protein
MRITRKMVLALLMSACLATAPAAEKTREPKTSLMQAVTKAEEYVSDKKIDISDLFLASVQRREYPQNPQQNCWTLVWSPKQANILDGELYVYVYDDGRIEAGGSA